jgi:hypothetical protein
MVVGIKYECERPAKVAAVLTSARFESEQWPRHLHRARVQAYDIRGEFNHPE